MHLKQSPLYQIECARRTLTLLATNLLVRRAPVAAGGPPRIGILKRGGIGDWILFHETLEAIANGAAQVEVTVFVEKQNREICEIIGLARHIHIVDPKTVRKSFRQRLALLNQVRAARFDVWVDADLARTRLGDAMALASESPGRIGFAANSTAPCHAWWQQRLFTHLLPDSFGRIHMSQRMAALGDAVRAALAERQVQTQAPGAARRSGLLAYSWEGAASTTMLIAPGASTPMRIWPIERFAEVVTALCGSRQMQPVIIGGPADRAACEQLQEMTRDCGSVNLAGHKSLAESLALMRSARLLLTNESGPMHMGRVTGMPTVVVASGADFTNYIDYPSADARFIAVTSADHSCFDCQWHCIFPTPPGGVVKRCLNDVGVAQVVAAAQSLLDAGAG